MCLHEKLVFGIYYTFKEAKAAVSDNELDRAHRTGSSYTDRITNKKCKSIIVRFTVFSHRTLLYGSRRIVKSGFKMKLNLTKSRFNLLKKASNYVKEIPPISFFYADANCHFRVKFHVVNQQDIFFSTFGGLRDIVDSEI